MRPEHVGKWIIGLLVIRAVVIAVGVVLLSVALVVALLLEGDPSVGVGADGGQAAQPPAASPDGPWGPEPGQGPERAWDHAEGPGPGLDGRP